MSLELLTEDEVSQIFKVAKSTINTWIQRDKFPKKVMIKIGGKKGTKRFIKSELEKWILNDECVQKS